MATRTAKKSTSKRATKKTAAKKTTKKAAPKASENGKPQGLQRVLAKETIQDNIQEFCDWVLDQGGPELDPEQIQIAIHGYKYFQADKREARGGTDGRKARGGTKKAAAKKAAKTPAAKRGRKAKTVTEEAEEEEAEF